jgi:hypothetical protein
MIFCNSLGLILTPDLQMICVNVDEDLFVAPQIANAMLGEA